MLYTHQLTLSNRIYPNYGVFLYIQAILSLSIAVCSTNRLPLARSSALRSSRLVHVESSARTVSQESPRVPDNSRRVRSASMRSASARAFSSMRRACSARSGASASQRSCAHFGHSVTSVPRPAPSCCLCAPQRSRGHVSGSYLPVARF